MRCNMVWVTRIEPRQGKPEAEGVIDEVGSFASNQSRSEAPIKRNGARLISRPIVFDIEEEFPISQRIAAYDAMHAKVRLTRRGWDRFKVGEYEITDARITDMKRQIARACLARNLLWRWEFRRVQNPNDPWDRSVWYLVTRLR